MGHQIKDVEFIHDEIYWNDAKFSKPTQTEIGIRLLESGCVLVLLESSGYVQITCGKYITDGAESKWVRPEYSIIENKFSEKYLDLERKGGRVIAWAEMPIVTYYLNNRKQ